MRLSLLRSLRNGFLPVLAAILALNLSACEFLYPDDDTPEDPNAFEYIADAPNLQILETALIATRLDEALQDDGPFTVFAPVDSAFATVDVDALLGQLDELRGVLTYHVIAGPAIFAADIVDGAMVPTVQGAELTFSVDDAGNVSVNGNRVIQANIPVSNGVIHLIGGVLLPPSE